MSIYKTGLIATLLALFTLITVAAVKSFRATPTKTALLASGNTMHASYRLYFSGEPSNDECELLLEMKNTGAKFISMGHVNVQMFKLQDANAESMNLALSSGPESMAYEQTGVTLLSTWDTANHPAPWTLSFDSDDGFVPLSLKIPGIHPQGPTANSR